MSSNITNLNLNNFNFNHRITLQKEIQNEGNFGEIIFSFEKIKDVWANINPINVNQNFSKLKQDIEVSHTIVIRYFELAKECKKILFNNRTFAVISVICPEEKREILLFNVKEIL